MAFHPANTTPVPAFDRSFYGSEETFSRIAGGSLGGKAEGLISVRSTLDEVFPGRRFGQIEVGIPRLTVLGTDVFDAFLERNDLRPHVLACKSDSRIAHTFLRADFPAEVLGDIRELVETVHTPLAVRSSSLLEDALHRPFAGVYETKMLPNNQPDPASRFQRLLEAIKLVFASTFFEQARVYRQVAGCADEDEKMAVIVQEVLGDLRGHRFYPHLSLVARSFNYYPTGRARPEDGVVCLALGLGKTIVDGGTSWPYAPPYPKAPPPFGSVSQLLRETQTRFWAVNMGPPTVFDPVAETEYLTEGDLSDAEYDDTLRYLASTYDGRSDRLSPGTGATGPRVLNFAPLLDLEEFPLNALVRRLLEACETAVGAEVEIEAAMTLPRTGVDVARFGFLQVRPMVAPESTVDIGPEELSGPDILAGSERAMGNGVVEGITDIVYVLPEAFDAKFSRNLAQEIGTFNRVLVEAGRPYLLIGFGRWGSSDPWLGIPVTWSQVSGAKVLVEAKLPGVNVDPSQGSHFFHNLSSFQVAYFTVRHEAEEGGIDWQWLSRQEIVRETSFMRQVRVSEPLQVRVDGRTGRGVIRK
ncbi:MAG: PEP/pyruvate-binding domain-containing protein [Gemmatimonadota bacterium]